MSQFNIQEIPNSQFNNQPYDDKDISLLDPISINTTFNNNDIIEYYVFNNEGTIIHSNYDFNNYRTINNTNNSSSFSNIRLNPSEDLINLGYEYGEYNVLYNFHRNLFGSSINRPFFIKDISPSRTELKISTVHLNFQQLQDLFINYTLNKNTSDFYQDFYLNAGNNEKFIVINVSLDNNPDEANLFIKLYKPLPINFGIKDTFWLHDTISDPYSLKLVRKFQYDEFSVNKPYIKGPNFDIEINENSSTTTQYLNLSNILDSNSTSSYNYIASLIKDNININIDYTDFTNFVHFSSAKERVDNFIYKLNQINYLEEDIVTLTNISSSSTNISSSLLNLKNRKNIIIQNFDGYEKFLYYESSSYTFPKLSPQKPYINVHPTSSEALTWIGSDDETSSNYGGILLSASIYDDNNRDYLYNNLPEYIKEDSQNEKVRLFTSMLGHYYDYIWTYIKDITNKNDNDNRLNHGISKDLIGNTLKSLGIKLYTNSNNKNNLTFSLLGYEGTNFHPSTGSLIIDTYVTSSQYSLPSRDINGELYKRIYHNLPLLLKKKGTRTGLRALINCFGIPSTILNVKEFGGTIKDQEFIEQISPKFNYSLNLNGTGSISIPNFPSYQRYIDSGSDNIHPDSFEFRVKFDKDIIYPTTQSILDSVSGSFGVRILNQGSGSGIIEMYQSSSSSFIPSLPLYNNNGENDWWNINISRLDNIGNSSGSSNNGCRFQLIVGNKNDWGIEYLNSSSLIAINDADFWNKPNTFTIGPFEGNIQEIRYRIGEFNKNDFTNYVLNPKSYTNTNNSSSLKNIIFRLPLGSELDQSIQPNLTSVHYNNTSSFYISAGISSSLGTLNLTSSLLYSSNEEKYHINSPNNGEYVESNNKIKISTEPLLPDNTLSPYVSIRKTLPNISKNSNNIEVGISPIDSINNDIINQLGNFNIDDYIGDPLNSSNNKYPDLELLKSQYFTKYTSKLNVTDLIKLLNYFENSLFKMVKDFTPYRSNINSGLIIKSHLLERNKHPRKEPQISKSQNTSSIQTAFIEGKDPASYEGDTISTTKDFLTSLGIITERINDNRELYDGEYRNSYINVHQLNSSSITYEKSLVHPTDTTSSRYWFDVPLNPLQNVVTGSRLNPNILRVDYFDNINKPTNINYLTSSLLSYNDINILYSDIQPTNNTLQRHILPRYLGSKLISQKVNEYNDGDISYGKSPNILDNKIKFAYFEEITSQSYTLPGRSDVYIKYLIDTDSNIINLSSKNENIFEVQSLFNNDNVDIILDNNISPSDQRILDGDQKIFSGGFKYVPILQNFANEFTTQNLLNFVYENDIEILNDGVALTENLPSNALILGNIELVDPPSLNPGLGINSNILISTLNSQLKIPVERNTSYAGEIRLKITGSVKITTSISPPQNIIGTAVSFQNNFGNFPIPQPLSDVNSIANQNNWTFNAWDNIGGFIIPIGTKLFVYNSTPGEWTTILTGNGSFQPVNSTYSGGVDGFKAVINDITVKQTINNLFNNLGNVPNITGINNIETDLEDIDGVSVDLIYPIEGLIILPPGVNNGELIIKNLQGLNGRIRSRIKFQTITPNSVIQFSTPPSLINQPIYNSAPPFYYTNPPEYLYITGSQDYGYNSGSSSNENWYFERKNSLISGSYFNKLVGSYYLSNIIYEQLVNNNNNFIQVLDISSSIGFEDIENYFQPKIGDLIRLYNHDKKEYPINFENEIKSIILPNSPPQSGSYDNRFIIELVNEIPNQACLDYIDSGSNADKILNFIILSKQKNETNIIINKGKNQGKTSSGIIIPSKLKNELKEKAGNIIKTLKNQNLIN